MGRPLEPSSNHWIALRKKVVNRDKECFICHTKQNLTVHHIKPRRKGGKTIERNLITMCDACHNRVEYYDMDWPAIINFQKQKRYRLDEDIQNPDETCKVGKDQFGIFVVRGIKQTDPIVYNGVWPEKKVNETPRYILIPV